MPASLESPESFMPTARGSTGDSGMRETLQVAFMAQEGLAAADSGAGSSRRLEAGPRSGVTLRERL